MKKIISLILVMLMVICSLPIVSITAYADESYGAYRYKILNDGTVEITDYTSNNVSTVTIPSSINGYIVTQIGDEAFYGHNVQELVIPYTVTKIGTRAFAWCRSLKSVTLPFGLMFIGQEAFSLAALTNITIPNTVVSIGSDAFEYCYLENVVIPTSVKSIGSGAFGRASSITWNFYNEYSDEYNNSRKLGFLVEYSDYIKNLTVSNCSVIPNSACAGLEKLETVTISNGVTSIGDCAFMDCGNLETITIPNSVKSIGLDAFTGCNKLTAEISCTSTIKNKLSSIGVKYRSSHDYNDWITLTYPTCTTSGQKYKSCRLCGDSIYNTIPKLNHQYRWTVVKPTYFKEGQWKGKCVDCGHEVVTSTIKKLKLQKPKNLRVKTKWLQSKKKYMYKAMWNKVKDASGYEVKIFDKYGNTVKSIKVKSRNKTSATMYSGGYKFHFKVRAYKTKNGKKVYSNWAVW